MDTSLTWPMEACMRSFGTQMKRNCKRTDTIWSVFRTRKFNRFRNNWYSYAIVEIIKKKRWKIHVFHFFSANSSPLWVNLVAIMRFRQPSWRWQKCVQRNSFNANGFNYCWVPKCAKPMRMLHNDFCFLLNAFLHNSMTPAIKIVRPSFVMKDKKKIEIRSWIVTHRITKMLKNKHDMIELRKKTTSDQTTTNAKRKISRKKYQIRFIFRSVCNWS